LQKGSVVEYSHYIYIRKSPRDFESITVSGCKTQQEAIDAAEDMARSAGWHNPKWYEYWRWGDRKVFSSPQPTVPSPTNEYP
jgi:hypothetical protein